jgi:hypothetical protein
MRLDMESLLEKKANKEINISTPLFQIGMDLYQEKNSITTK